MNEQQLRELDEQGYTVVPDVVPEYEQLRANIWEELSIVCPEFRVDGNLEQKKGLFKMGPLHSMLYQHFVGHMQSVWDVRQHEGVNRVFRQLWNTDELYTSFDGISALVPPEETKRGFYRGDDWMHVDQSPKKEGRLSVQGYLNLYESGEGDGSLMVVPGSHLEKRAGGNADWLPVPGRLGEAVRVQASAGSMVLWDSRLVHQGGQPVRGRPAPNPRLVVYVCQLPRERLNPMEEFRRRKYFAQRRTTNHWGTKLFSKTPRFYSAEAKQYYAGTLARAGELPLQLSALGKSLI